MFLFGLPVWGQEIVNLELSPHNKIHWEVSIDGNHWEPISIPSNILEKEKYREKSVFHVRTKFDFPYDPNIQYSIRLGAVSERDMVYLNDTLIGSTGDFPQKTPRAYDKIRIYEIPSYLLEEKNNELHIVIEKYFDYEAGILEEVPKISQSSTMQKELLQQEYKKIALLAVYLAISVYFLFLYVKVGFELENLLFALASISLVVYQFLRTQIKFEIPFTFISMKKVEYVSLVLAISLYCNFIHVFLINKNRNKKSFKKEVSNWLHSNRSRHWKLFWRKYFIHILNIFSIIGLILYFQADTLIEYDFFNKNYLQPIFLSYILCILHMLFLHTFKKRKNAQSLLLVTLILGTSVVLDIMIDRNMLQLPRTSGYVFIFFHIVVGFILANRLIQMKKEVEELNLNLEDKIKVRTKELNNSLQEIRELKFKQDADYFLTTLLVNPLQKDENKSKNVKSETYTNQKKKFDFKNKTYQIGGDISICDNIKINGRQYTIVLNGDAMGKSIQGAGGAIVLGILFRTILNRSKDIVINQTSEKWLEGVFLEMQRAFESFGGSMFVSTFIGLIDDFSGMFYYINAEHPGIVLYRDGKACFLEHSNVTRKLGTPENQLQVHCFQLRDSDIVFAGSDGRDDLLIYENGSSSYNQDENLFLKQIEESNGHLYTLVYNIMEKGEITDDLSILKLQYFTPKFESKQIYQFPDNKSSEQWKKSA